MDTPLLSLNHPAPDFSLTDLDGHTHTLSAQRGRIVVLCFWAAECGWCEQSAARLANWLADWGGEAALFLAACNPYEDDAALRQAERLCSPGVLLDDRLQTLTHRYGARTTPHAFVIDRDGVLRYQGAFDDRSFRKREPERFYLREAVERLLAQESPEPAQVAPYGCLIPAWQN